MADGLKKGDKVEWQSHVAHDENDRAMTPPSGHRPTRPAGVDDATVKAVGVVSEALEYVERARGHLYEFHQLMGHADLLLGDACDSLRDAGHTASADRLTEELVGRNVINGRWTFQIIEEFDDDYWSVFRAHERRVRDELMQGERHVFEAEMKERRRTAGKRGHESRP